MAAANQPIAGGEIDPHAHSDSLQSSLGTGGTDRGLRALIAIS
jgi:hypothetical protein